MSIHPKKTLRNLGLPPKALRGLLADEHQTYGDIAGLTDRDLLLIPGIGRVTLAGIRKIVPRPSAENSALLVQIRGELERHQFPLWDFRRIVREELKTMLLVLAKYTKKGKTMTVETLLDIFKSWGTKP